MVNLDGRYYVEKIKNYCWRGISIGVDFDRNFGWEFGGKGSLSDIEDEEYRGKDLFLGKLLKGDINYILLFCLCFEDITNNYLRELFFFLELESLVFQEIIFDVLFDVFFFFYLGINYIYILYLGKMGIKLWKVVRRKENMID